MNWLTTKEGQIVWNEAVLEGNSRRTDVPPFEPESVPKPGRQYVNVTHEDTLAEAEKTREVVFAATGITN